MLLSRTKPAQTAGNTVSSDPKSRSKVPTLEEFVKNRDFTGALTLLEFTRNSGKGDLKNDLWIAYCAFHLSDYRRAMEEYNHILKSPEVPPEVWTYLGCCYFYLGMYKEADAAVNKGPKSELQNRLQFHLSHKFGDEKLLMVYHQQLKDILEDQLSLASIHYLRSHYQEAIDIYKHILLDNRESIALNVYVALCYYKLDYYDVSQEVLAVYLQHYPDSATAINLKACNHFRLYNGKAAEAELKSLQDISSPSFTYAKDLIRHNLVVFRGGEGALQVLPPLVDVFPEARLNLVIYHLKQDNVQEAFNLIKDLEPAVPHEYILKGVVNAANGQEQGSREYLKVAQQYFQLVGGSASECDTIPGRQCMASCFFLLKQFDDSYFYNDDTFNFNFAQAKAATAWELYSKLEHCNESFSLLQQIANDCYKMGQFFYAAKAFDILERSDPNPEFWEGKRGACVGVIQMIIAGHEPSESLQEIFQILRSTTNPQAEKILRVAKTWAKESKLSV
ncbi:intraflagellar transport protein 56 [Caerostris extrusa]|uniref:Intraflagellar transport protein 56 n=1 Tax=Caerostris extrusa TaxID=172846 RepID=A0AAV4RV25_CAEEX|nr:intraflagellar transport protein 56 [Caerostris extrusa]